MSTLKQVKVVIDMIKSFPTLSLLRVEQGKHIKLTVETPNGKKLLVLSRSTSDFRAIQNNRSLLRQWAQSQGESK